jgi:hypothetical protein
MEEARQKTHAALAVVKPNEVLDAVIEAVNILLDLNEVGGVDQSRLTSLENAVNAPLQVLEPTLIATEGKFDFTATVGPLGFQGGHLLSTVLAAFLRSVGFKAVSLGKTQTALEILRNSEELRADIVIPLLPKEEFVTHLSNLRDLIQRGGFSGKFQVIPIARGLPESITTPIYAAKNVDEAVSKALEWAIKNSMAE